MKIFSRHHWFYDDLLSLYASRNFLAMDQSELQRNCQLHKSFRRISDHYKSIIDFLLLGNKWCARNCSRFKSFGKGKKLKIVVICCD